MAALARRTQAGRVELEEAPLDQQGEVLRRQRLLELLADDELEALPRDAGAQPQPHHQKLVPPFLAAQGTALAAGMAGGLDLVEPGLGRAMLAGGIALAVEGQPAMGAGTDADVVAALPIDQIVAAFGARPRMVGDLVGG